MKGYFKKSVGKKGILGLDGCDLAICSRSSTLFFQDLSERAMRSRSHVGGYDGSFDVCEKDGKKAYVPTSSFWNSATTKRKIIIIAAIRPGDVSSWLYIDVRLTNLSMTGS